MTSLTTAVDLVQAGLEDHVKQPRKRGRPRLEPTFGSPGDAVAVTSILIHHGEPGLS